MVKNYNEVLYRNERIETDRLVLRKFRIEDAADLFEYASDEEVTKTLMWAGVKTMEEAVAGIYDHLWAAPGRWAIEHKETGKVIGSIDIILKKAHDKASFAYASGKNFWGKGYMTEALKALVKICFEQLEVNRAEARCYSENPGSWRVMEKAGMTREGVARQGELVKGKFRDVVFMGMTRDDYFGK
ncbi:MAG: GNAT family N-acetyltransferase [Defluviitaleaceae bacterium]|nr:GNAT family N-acetyltransferase [Defluviitaleaceae bacterium]